jgi:hypothetical protein
MLQSVNGPIPRRAPEQNGKTLPPENQGSREIRPGLPKTTRGWLCWMGSPLTACAGHHLSLAHSSECARYCRETGRLSTFHDNNVRIHQQIDLLLFITLKARLTLSSTPTPVRMKDRRGLGCRRYRPHQATPCQHQVRADQMAQNLLGQQYQY